MLVFIDDSGWIPISSRYKWLNSTSVKNYGNKSDNYIIEI